MSCLSPAPFSLKCHELKASPPWAGVRRGSAVVRRAPSPLLDAFRGSRSGRPGTAAAGGSAEGGSERLGTRMFMLVITGVNWRCVRCVTYSQYIMGFPIFRSS